MREQRKYGKLEFAYIYIKICKVMNSYSYILILSRQATANARVLVAQKESKIVPEAAHVRDKTITAPTNASVVLVINHAKIG